MDLLMNGLLIAATLFAGGYCWVLARRVRDLKSLDSGLGGAIVTLTRQVELARTTLDEARTASRDTRQDLAQLVAKADGAAGQLRLLIAAAPLPAAAPQPMPQYPCPCPSLSPSRRCRPAATRPCPAGGAGPGHRHPLGAEAARPRAGREPAPAQGRRARAAGAARKTSSTP